MINFFFKWFRRITVIFWALLVLFLGGWLAFENTQPMEFTLFSFKLPGLSVGIYVSIILLVGVIIGFVFYWLAKQGKMFELKRLKKEVSQLKKEIELVQASKLQN